MSYMLFFISFLMIQVIFQMNVLEILLFLAIYCNSFIVNKTQEKRVDRSSQQKLD